MLLAAAIVGFGFIGSRLLGILRTVAIAHEFGSSPELGAYNVAFRVPDLIFQVLAGATLGSAFIPVFARLYRRDGDEAAWRLASTMINLVTAGTAVLCVIGFIFAPVLVPLLAPGLGDDVGRGDELTAEAVRLTRIMLLSPLLFSISGMLTGILNARQRFLLPALAPMLYNLAIIAGALVLARPWGITGLAVGVVAGAGLHLAIQLPGLFRERMRYTPSFDWADRAVLEVGKLMGPRVIGLAAAQLNFLVATYFASRVGTAEISDLNYAWLLAQLPLAIFGMAISTAVFPRLADHAAGDELRDLTATLARAFRIIMFLTIPAAIGVALLRVPLTTVLLERGEFTRVDTLLTAAALGWYALGIVPQAGIEIHSRGFYALGDTRTPVALAVGAVGLNLGLSAWLYADYGISGLAFSLSIASWFEWLMLYFAYTVRTRAPAAADLRAAAVFSVCGALMGLILSVAFSPLDDEGMLSSAVVAFAGCSAGALLYAAFASIAGVPELTESLARLRSILGRRGHGAVGDDPAP